MCGITAHVGTEGAVDTLVTCLENLEYRGYDSAGIALSNGVGVSVTKTEGKVADLKTKLATDRPDGGIGIGHTRWSTHGPPSDENAHPHTDCTGRVAVVHNGIIDNHDELRAALLGRGHTFTSDTDTEVVPHLVSERLDAGDDPETAFRNAIAELEGSYAVAMILEGDQRVFATRSGSPLVLGLGDDINYLASDVPAFLEFTDRVVYLEDGDVAVVTSDSYRITDVSGQTVDRSVETVEWEAEAAEKGGYDHYMFKEIQEQPTALRQTLEGRVLDGEVRLDGLSLDSFEDVSSVQFVACGTSYHAGLYGEHLLSTGGVPATTHLASEYAVYPPPIDDETLVVPVTQSGETADTLEALRVAQRRNAKTLAVTNTVGSTAARETDDALFIRAGPEIGVAATKTFSSQVATLLLLAQRLTADVIGEPLDPNAERIESLGSLPSFVRNVLQSSGAQGVSDRYLSDDGHFFIGRGNAVPVALEGALKFKEITYEHAEGFPAGELKHGPLALVTPETPVFAVCTGRDAAKLESSIREVQTRGAPVVAIAPRSMSDVIDVADEALTVPATHPDVTPILTNVQLQLVAYHAASKLGRSIDKPRNLAKSVTVE
ncbi:MAG: glutamine--fructose-6-phosphate transaminase (isomerizing) [Halanaeroarchaeum sp.]